MDPLTVISTGLAAFAAAFAAISAVASMRSTRAVETQVELSRDVAMHQLLRTFESDYARQYRHLVSVLGPWEDPLQVDPDLRRVVHDACQSLASVYVARTLGLVGVEQGEYVEQLFIDWLRIPAAAAVWRGVFRVQRDTWPDGFVEFVDGRLAAVA